MEALKKCKMQERWKNKKHLTSGVKCVKLKAEIYKKEAIIMIKAYIFRMSYVSPKVA